MAYAWRGKQDTCSGDRLLVAILQKGFEVCLFCIFTIFYNNKNKKCIVLRSLFSNTLSKRWNNFLLPYDSGFNIHRLHEKIVMGPKFKYLKIPLLENSMNKVFWLVIFTFCISRNKIQIIRNKLFKKLLKITMANSIYTLGSLCI